MTLDWNQLARHATGEDLNPKAFAEDLKAAVVTLHQPLVPN